MSPLGFCAPLPPPFETPESPVDQKMRFMNLSHRFGAMSRILGPLSPSAATAASKYRMRIACRVSFRHAPAHHVAGLAGDSTKLILAGDAKAS